ncbi:MAG: hypothetical protein HRU36_02205 [Rickettsiales bacterium]|nr:hypothetical protein [Rickettsiales bacterium]
MGSYFDSINFGYVTPSIPTIKTLAVSAAYLGAQFYGTPFIPQTFNYAYQNSDFIIKATVFGLTSFGAFRNQFDNDHGVIANAMATSILGAGYYGVYYGVKSSMSYVNEKFSLNLSEEGQEVTSIFVTAGIIPMTPLPLQELIISNIDKATGFLVSTLFCKRSVDEYEEDSIRKDYRAREEESDDDGVVMSGVTHTAGRLDDLSVTSPITGSIPLVGQSGTGMEDSSSDSD